MAEDGWDRLSVGDRSGLSGLAQALEEDLEELDAAPTVSLAQVILDRIRGMRAAHGPAGPALGTDRAGGGSGDPGFWLCFRPGRSLGGGEAEVASRGFFDVFDRPPLGLWVDVIARPKPSVEGAFEVALLCWIPPDAAERARAGLAHCPTGGLALFEALVAGVPPPGPCSEQSQA
jgi:hypothetical protein